MSNGNKAFVSLDKFGNEYQVIGLKDKKGSGFGKGFVEIKGDLFKIEVSPAQKEGVTEWVRLTKMSKKQNRSRGW